MPTKILMFGWEFPPYNSGGLGVACYGLAKKLAEKGTHITFVLPKEIPVDAPFMKFAFADSSRITVKTVNALLKAYITSDEYGNLLLSRRDGIYGPTLFEEVRRYALLAGEIAKKEDFDIIHAHDWLSFLAGMEAKRITGKPLVVHVHATEFDRSGGINVNSFVFDVEKSGMEHADVVLSVSDHTKNIISKRYGISSDKIRTAHNGVEFAEPSHDDNLPAFKALKKAGKKIVLFVGRITLQKGPDYLVHAARIVRDYDPNVIFVIAGSGDMEGQMLRQTASMGISNTIFFAGFLRGNELAQAYNSADVFVMPSVSEPFGLVALEALQYEVPVIISKQSGVSEVLHHALKVDFWDVEELAHKILSVTSMDAIRKCVRNYAHEEVRRNSWDNAADICLQTYAQLSNRQTA